VLIYSYPTSLSPRFTNASAAARAVAAEDAGWSLVRKQNPGGHGWTYAD
jgi:hypothetical protein